MCRRRRNPIITRVLLKNLSFHFEDYDLENDDRDGTYSIHVDPRRLRTRSRSENDIQCQNEDVRTPLLAEFHPDTGELIHATDLYNNNEELRMSHEPFFEGYDDDHHHHQLLSSVRRQQSSCLSGVTTLMVRNIPSRYLPHDFRRLVSSMGFANDMDFFYMPMDIVKSRNLRYAFINFVSETVAARFIDLFSGYRFDDDNNSYYRGSAGSSKVCEISPARVQGFYPNVDHFQNSTTRFNIPNNFKPIVIENGEEIPIQGYLKKGRSNSHINTTTTNGLRHNRHHHQGRLDRSKSSVYY